MRIIPESERKLMRRKELDLEFDGKGVLLDDRNHWFREMGFVLAYCDNTDDDWNELLNYAQDVWGGECSLIYAVGSRHPGSAPYNNVLGSGMLFEY